MMKRGGKVGRIVNPRDARGWRIPHEGTKRRLVYNAMVAGKSTRQIAGEMGISIPAVSMQKRAITQPDYVNAMGYEHNHGVSGRVKRCPHCGSVLKHGDARSAG